MSNTSMLLDAFTVFKISFRPITKSVQECRVVGVHVYLGYACALAPGYEPIIPNTNFRAHSDARAYDRGQTVLAAVQILLSFSPNGGQNPAQAKSTTRESCALSRRDTSSCDPLKS
eukprot:1038602-Rhodomonas_salina.2